MRRRYGDSQKDLIIAPNEVYNDKPIPIKSVKENAEQVNQSEAKPANGEADQATKESPDNQTDADKEQKQVSAAAEAAGETTKRQKISEGADAAQASNGQKNTSSPDKNGGAEEEKKEPVVADDSEDFDGEPGDNDDSFDDDFD